MTVDQHPSPVRRPASSSPERWTPGRSVALVGYAAAGRPAGSPHSGHRSVDARRSYPQIGQRPAPTLRLRRAYRVRSPFQGVTVMEPDNLPLYRCRRLFAFPEDPTLWTYLCAESSIVATLSAAPKSAVPMPNPHAHAPAAPKAKGRPSLEPSTESGRRPHPPRAGWPRSQGFARMSRG